MLPPWAPVALITVMIFLPDIFKSLMLLSSNGAIELVMR
jgi:hypothetical protein